MTISKSSLITLLIGSGLLHYPIIAAEKESPSLSLYSPSDNVIDESDVLPFYLESRLYVGDNNAFGTTLNTQAWGFVFKAGVIATFDNENADGSERDPLSFDVMAARRFVIDNDWSMDLGLGAVKDSAIADYALNYSVNNRLSLSSGYRFHFADDFDNRNQFFLGLSFTLREKNKRVPTIAPSVALPVISTVIEQPTPIILESDVNFEFGKSELKRPESLEPLIKDIINNLVSGKVTIVGFTDAIGTLAYNQQLSLDRANTVKTYFVSKGITMDNIIVVGMGEAHPIASNETEEGRAENRRVEISYQGMPTENVID